MQTQAAHTDNSTIGKINPTGLSCRRRAANETNLAQKANNPNYLRLAELAR